MRNEPADEISLCGRRARIKERLQAWVDSLVTTMLVGAAEPRTLKIVADAPG